MYPILSSVSHLTKEKNIRTTPDNSLYITAMLFSVFYKNNFIRTSFDFGQKSKNNKNKTSVQGLAVTYIVLHVD